MYKDILPKIDKVKSLESILQYYSASMFQLRETNKYFELIFNRQFNSPILVPKLTEDMIRLSPSFYIDDDSVILPLDLMLYLTIIDRLNYFRKQEYKYKNHRFLRKDLAGLMKGLINIEPSSRNNRIKLESRVRVVKTYTYDKKGNKVYRETLGDALWDLATPNTEPDIINYSLLFNDPIAVASITDGVYCNLKGKIIAPGYFSDNKQISSIYEAKSSLPERLRIQYTSAYLPPVSPDIDYLSEENNSEEKTNAITVFLPVDSENQTNFEGNHPLGKWTLLTGEVLINEELANKTFYVRRTFQTETLDCDIVQQGDILQPGDVIAYDSEGLPSLIYDLNYKDALVEEIITLPKSYKIILKVESPMSVARVVSEYGLKGVTHPRKELGEIKLPHFLDDKVMPVQMIVGATSLKSGHNGIKLAWANLLASLTDLPENIWDESLDPMQNSVEMEERTSTLIKVDWTYKGKTTKVYAGLMSFGVTDLAKDCRSTGVRIMPETLKYMYASPNTYLHDTADSLLLKYVDTGNKWLLTNLLKLKTKIKLKDDNVPVFEWNNPEFQELLASSYFNVANWSYNKKGLNGTNNIFLNPFNNGFYVKFNDTYFRMPSADVLNALTYIGQGSVNYPQFLTHAMFLIMSIKGYFNGKNTEEQVLENFKKYLFYVDDEIFSKRAALPMCTSPVVEGGNLKQLVSAHVPRGVTVILDKNLEQQVEKFMSFYRKPVYEIGVRNPVLWRFQFIPRRVWTFKQFIEHLKKKEINIEDVLLPDCVVGAVLRNTVDTLFDKSDTDGDLFPVAIPMDPDIQDMLNKYQKKPTKLKDYEKKWIFDYIDGELSKNEKFLDVENKPFTYHTISRKDFSRLLADAGIAKAKVGTGTIDLWKFHSAVEWYFIDGKINEEQKDFLMFLFSNIVQSTVVEGIKHCEGGSSGYDIFALSTMQDNQDVTKKVLMDNFGVSEEYANLFVVIALEANENKYSKAIARLPNGGMSSQVSQMTVLLNAIDDHHRQISYCKVLSQYWDILKDAAPVESSNDENSDTADEVVEMVY